VRWVLKLDSTIVYLIEKRLLLKCYQFRSSQYYEVVKTVNFVKLRHLNSRLFSAICQEMGSDHISLVLRTAVRLLSRGKLLSRVLELHDELRTFLLWHDYEYATLLSGESWIAKLAYLSDIYSHLNEIDRKMLSKDEPIFSTTKKIEGFKGTLKLWLVYLEKGSIEICAHWEKMLRSYH
jgi:hypothetical protein